MTKASGGYNSAINGNPQYAPGSVLSNCVGYAQGRFGAICSEFSNYKGIEYNTLNCNAENFIERAIKAGLDIDYKYPRLGGIMVFAKGEPGHAEDGAGHVLIVEDIYNMNAINASESFYNGLAFINQDRNNANGRWGLSSEYSFRGCIINPYIPTIIEPQDRNKHLTQIKVNTDSLHCRVKPGLKESVLGYLKPGIYTYTETKEKDGYKWYKLDNYNWCANVEVEELPYEEYDIKAKLIKIQKELEEVINEL